MQIENMQLKIEAGVGLLAFGAWESLPVVHAFSTRIGGVSRNEFAAMNLGFGRGDSDENVAENFRRIAAALGFRRSASRRARRTTTRSCAVSRWKMPAPASGNRRIWRAWTAFDRHAGAAAARLLRRLCAALLLRPEAPRDRLSHAGWRGTVNGMAKATIEKMQAEFGTDPADLLAAVGPSISKRSFEVDEPCAAEFPRAARERCVCHRRRNGKFHVDLWECNRRYMLACGMRPERITVGGVCTMENSDLVFSHRVTRGKRGSNAAFLMLGEVAE